MRELASLVDDFVEQLAALVESDTLERVRAQVSTAFVGGRGAPLARGSLALVPHRRRKGPIQLCPVPGCSNRAAPVFGMVCSDHKDVPKKKIRAFREARRAKKLGGPAKRATAQTARN